MHSEENKQINKQKRPKTETNPPPPLNKNRKKKTKKHKTNTQNEFKITQPNSRGNISYFISNLHFLYLSPYSVHLERDSNLSLRSCLRQF